MEQLKFRAWDKECKEMAEVTGINFEGSFIFPDPNVLISTRCDLLLFDDVELMQFTGLKDKDGTEVYEGDIIKCTSNCPHEVIFKLEHGGNVLGGMPTFYLSGLSEGYQWTGDEEIIGNIYETPGILMDL